MEILGLKFAKWNVPFQRRLQTLTVFAFMTTCMLNGTLGPIIFLYLFFTPYYFLSIAYLVWMYYDWKMEERGGRAIEWLRRLTVLKIIASYFPIRLIKTTDLEPDKNYVFGYHPHGIAGTGCVMNFGSEATGFGALFPGIRPHVATLAGNFLIPFHRETLLAMGFCSVSKKSIEWILSKKGKGNAVAIVVGGAAEALDARPGEAKLTLKNRKGFVKMAIKHGASLVPIYSFGENDLYDQVYNPTGSPLRRLQDKLKDIVGVSPPIFHGRGIFNYTFGFLPHRRKIVTVVGKPIEVIKIENPSAEEVDEVHGKYLQELTLLYEKFRMIYGDPEKDLQFI